METIKFRNLKTDSLFEFNGRVYIKTGRSCAKDIGYNPPVSTSECIDFVNRFFFHKNELVKSNSWNIKKWYQL